MRNRKYEKCCGCARVREIKSLIFGPFSYNVHRTDTAEQSRIQHIPVYWPLAIQLYNIRICITHINSMYSNRITNKTEQKYYTQNFCWHCQKRKRNRIHRRVKNRKL